MLCLKILPERVYIYIYMVCTESGQYIYMKYTSMFRIVCTFCTFLEAFLSYTLTATLTHEQILSY